MRFLAVVLVGGASALASCSTRGRPPWATASIAPTLPAARPPWVPAPTEAQAALLASSRTLRVDEPAAEVYADLARFAYVSKSPFDDDRARAARAAVERTVGDSPRSYVLATVPPEVANPTALHGPPPPPTPDRWVAARGPADAPRLEWASVPDGAASLVAEANAAIAGGDLAAAIAKLEAAITAAPSVPALHLALSEARAATGDDEGALAAAEGALAVDSRQPDGYRLVAEARARRGDFGGARAAIARALALHPAWERAWAVAAAVATIRPRPVVPWVFVAVGAGGAIHVGTEDDDAARAYGTCRAAVRYEPALRRELLGFPPEAPYHLSLGEELFCLEAMLGAAPAVAARANAGASPDAGVSPDAGKASDTDAQATAGSPPDAGAPSDAGARPGADARPATEDDSEPLVPGHVAPPGAAHPAAQSDLAEIARAGWLREYAAFDGIGRHRPEWLRIAPAELHEAIVAYVLERVLEPRRR